MSLESKVKDTGRHPGTISYKAFCRAAESLSSGEFWSLRKPSPNSLLAGVPGHIYLSGREIFLPAPPPSTPHVTHKRSVDKHNCDKDVASHGDDELLATFPDLEPNDDGVIKASGEKSDTKSTGSTPLSSHQSVSHINGDYTKRDQGCTYTDCSVDRLGDGETGSTLVGIRHEVLYQTAYEVPLMILKASNPDGSPVGLERANEILKYWQRKESTLPVPEAKCYLIQQDHPVEGCPVLAMKVCQLNKLLSIAFSAAEETSGKEVSRDDLFKEMNYLPCWLSIVGRFVGLDTGGACKLARTSLSCRDKPKTAASQPPKK
mmetsp:Transcript_2254/g.2811  ORF Transcript_2254/g.2811 Transcript_2254/m.2811 type:complete len:318 (-) Transcript_2254:20-973(-)